MTVSSDSNPTDATPESQPSNGYGRVPDSLLPTLRKLTHLEAHVFLILTIVANRKREPLGGVCLSVAALARECAIERRSLQRCLKGLEDHGLVQRATSGRTTCVMVTHYMRHEDAPPASPCRSETPQPTEQLRLVSPRNDLRNDRNGGRRAKRKRSPPKPKVVWDKEAQKVKALDEEWRDDFQKRWIEKLGEDTFAYQLEKLNAWLARPDKAGRRSATSRIDQTMENWMMRAL